MQQYQRTSMAAPPRYLQSSIAPPGQHIRRQPRPRSVHLETLVEREVEEDNGSELGVVGSERSSMTHPGATSSSNSYSSSQDNSTYQPRATTTPGLSSYTRPHSRRLNSYPLRSSPLAGPSVALTHDGTLTNVTATQRPRSLLSICESMYDHSPSPSANPSLENLNNASAVMEDKENDSALPPTPPAKAKQSPSKKLSLGLKKLTALPSLPKRISASIPTPPDHSFVTKGKSKEKNNTSMAAEAAAPTPDIPKVPVWAGPGHVPTRTGSRAPMPFRPHSPNLLHPGSATLNRRASQASLTPSVASSVQSSSKSTHRRSMALSAHPIPSTSRDPELNWLSTAAPPKFSRLSLKADGVVMPVSAKEMRRRSTASLNRTGSVSSMNSTRTSMSRISESGVSSDRERRRRSVTFDLNTLRKLEGNKPVDPRLSNPPASSSTPPPSRPSTPIISQGLSALSEEDDSDIVSPPLPPFFTSSKNGSASSISSSAGTVSEESDITETPSLSRTSSITEDEESGLPNTPPGTITNTGSVGVVSEATKDLHIRATKPVVKTAEAVTVNVVGVCAPGHSRNEGSSGVKSLDCGDGKLGRRRTLKRMWGKVFSGRSSSMPALKV